MRTALGNYCASDDGTILSIIPKRIYYIEASGGNLYENHK